MAVLNTRFGQGSVPIAMGSVACVGNEATLLDCPHIESPSCSHVNDAGVACHVRTSKHVTFSVT